MRLQRGLLLATLLALALSACGDDEGSANLPDGGEGSEAGGTEGGAEILAGLWHAELDGPGSFGIPGTMSIEFPDASSGRARFLGRHGASGVTTCSDYFFAVVDGRVVFLESTTLPSAAFVIDRIDEDTLTLTSDFARVRLTRVTGSPPVAPCGTASSQVVARLERVETSSWSSLSAVGRTLYFNLNEDDAPLVGFSLESRTLGTPRVYSGFDSNPGRYAVAAESDDIFWGHCACGSGTHIHRIDFASNTRLDTLDTQTFGDVVHLRFGAFTGSELVLGGRFENASRLLRIDPAALTLNSQLTLLVGFDIVDIAWLNQKLYALLRTKELVEVANDGFAVRTHRVPALDHLWPQGLEAVDDELFILAREPNEKTTTLLQVTLD